MLALYQGAAAGSWPAAIALICIFGVLAFIAWLIVYVILRVMD